MKREVVDKREEAGRSNITGQDAVDKRHGGCRRGVDARERRRREIEGV
jgi:hypothetical protein